MKLIYLIHLVVVILGLILATKLYFNIKQGKFLPKTCPRIFGIGAGTFMFADSMIASILQRLLSEALEYTVNNFVWSLLFGIVVYIGGHIIAQRVDKK